MLTLHLTHNTNLRRADIAQTFDSIFFLQSTINIHHWVKCTFASTMQEWELAILFPLTDYTEQ